MKKLKFPEVFHTHINLSGRSEVFGGFKKICLRCIYFHATVSSSLPSRCSSLTPTSDQCKRAPPKNISSPIWKSEGIRLGWVLKRFLSVAFPSASPASVCPRSLLRRSTVERQLKRTSGLGRGYVIGLRPSSFFRTAATITPFLISRRFTNRLVLREDWNKWQVSIRDDRV